MSLQLGSRIVLTSRWLVQVCTPLSVLEDEKRLRKAEKEVPYLTMMGGNRCLTPEAVRPCT